MRYLAIAALLLIGFQDAEAACTDNAAGTPVWDAVTSTGNLVRYTGDCTEDDEELIVTNDVSQYDVCTIISLTGLVDIYVSNDGGSNYTTAPHSLLDFGATDQNPVLVTAALRRYAFPLVGITNVKVVQSGVTDASAVLTCTNAY